MNQLLLHTRTCISLKDIMQTEKKPILKYYFIYYPQNDTIIEMRT